MWNESELEWIEKNCPTLFCLLNQRARRHLPSGLIGFYQESGPDNGKELLVAANKRAEQLVARCGIKAVGDAYRRDLSGVANENQLVELLCEITVCAGVTKLSSSAPKLRPSNGRDKHECDLRVEVAGALLYAEVKRYEDPWPSSVSKSRAVMKVTAGSKRSGSRPRQMDLRSKLTMVLAQFPIGTTNLLFVFHRSIGESHRYLQQVFFGEKSFSKSAHDVAITDNDALFAKDEWREVGGCALLQFQNAVLQICQFRPNPRAKQPIPETAITKLDTELC